MLSENMLKKISNVMVDCSVIIFLLMISIQLCTMHMHFALPAPVFKLSRISSHTDSGPIHGFFSPFFFAIDLHWYNTEFGKWISSFSMYHFPCWCYDVLRFTVYWFVMSCILWQINIYELIRILRFGTASLVTLETKSINTHRVRNYV